MGFRGQNCSTDCPGGIDSYLDGSRARPLPTRMHRSRTSLEKRLVVFKHHHFYKKPFSIRPCNGPLRPEPCGTRQCKEETFYLLKPTNGAQGKCGLRQILS